MRRGRLQAHSNGESADSNKRKGERSFWTRLANCRSRHRRSCCAWSKRGSLSVSEVRSRSRWTSESFATNRDLEMEVRERRFRADLFSRLNVFPIHVPRLRERREDIPLLVAALVGTLRKRLGRSLDGVDESALLLLRSYDWPGNVRELQNVLERAAILARGRVIVPEDLPDLGVQLHEGTAADGTTEATLKWRVDSYERSLIAEALRQSDGNQSHAPRRLHPTRATLPSKTKA